MGIAPNHTKAIQCESVRVQVQVFFERGPLFSIRGTNTMPTEVTVKNIEITATRKVQNEVSPRHSGVVHIAVSGSTFGFFQAQTKFEDVPGGLSNAIIRGLEDVKTYSEELTAAVERELAQYRSRN